LIRRNQDYPTSSDTVFQAETRSRNIANDPGYDLNNVLRQIAGGNQGFIADFAQLYPRASIAERRGVMGYYPYGFLPALDFLASAARRRTVIREGLRPALPGVVLP
jgi:hypothetical protein